MTADNERRIKTTMSTAETIMLGNLLGTHCLPIEGTEYHQYAEDWDDVKMAKQANRAGLGPDHIKRLRASLGMRLKKQGPAPTPAFDPRVDDLIDRFNKLCDGITLNKVGSVDVRHLKVKV